MLLNSQNVFDFHLLSFLHFTSTFCIFYNYTFNILNALRLRPCALRFTLYALKPIFDQLHEDPANPHL